MKKVVANKVSAPKVSASDYTTQLLEDLKDPAEAAAYIEAATIEGDYDGILMALQHVNRGNSESMSLLRKIRQSAAGSWSPDVERIPLSELLSKERKP